MRSCDLRVKLWPLNHHSTQRCLVKPTQWVRLTQFISPLCVTSPCGHGNGGGSRTKTGVFHQDPPVRITQCVCVHVCSFFIMQQLVWSVCFYTVIEPMVVSSPVLASSGAFHAVMSFRTNVLFLSKAWKHLWVSHIFCQLSLSAWLLINKITFAHDQADMFKERSFQIKYLEKCFVNFASFWILMEYFLCFGSVFIIFAVQRKVTIGAFKVNTLITRWHKLHFNAVHFF